MGRELSEKDLDETLDAHAGSVWRNAKAAVYVQNSADRIDLFANPFLRKITGATHLTSTQIETVSDWIQMLSASSSLEVILVPQQNLYGVLCALAGEKQWTAQVRRFARKGDCRGGGNFGTENEEAYAKEVLEVHGRGDVRSVVIERVIGTELLLMQANFLYSEEEFFAAPFKSCRQMEEIEQFLQQLYFGKELKVALSTDPELSRWFQSRGGVVERIWKTVQPSDGPAARERSRAATNHARYAAKSSSRNKPALSWLDAARKAAGLLTGSNAAANAGSNGLRRPHVAAFIAAKRATSAEEYEAVLRSLSDCAEPTPAGLEIVDAARAIALSALGRRPPGALFDLVLQPNAKNQLWWADAVKALMRHVFTAGEPAGWLAKVFPLASDLIGDVALESDDRYLAARRALEEYSPMAMLDCLPFETCGLAEELNDLYKQMREMLGPANRLTKLSDADDLSDLAYYRVFELMRARCSKPLQQLFLRRGCAKWGKTKRYFSTATFTDWLEEVPVEQTLEMCGEWRALYPDDVDAWCFTGRVLAADERSSEGLEFFDHALRLKPDDPESARRKAECLWMLDQDDAAIALLEELRRREEKDVAVDVLLARIHSFAKRDGLACEIFTSLEDSDIDANNGLFSFLISLARSCDWRECEERFSELATKLNEPQHAWVLEALANRMFDTERFTDAAFLVPHIQWNPEVWRCLAPICDALAEAGAVDKAFDLYETARTRALGGADLYYYYTYFCRYCPVPDPARAIAVCREGIVHFPEDEWLRVAAGMAANASGEDPAPFWNGHLDKLTETPEAERTTAQAHLLAYGLWFSGLHREAEGALTAYMAMKQEVIADVYLFHALIALTVGASVEASYAQAATVLNALPASRRRESWRWHLLDLEAYAERGYFSDLPGAIAAAKRWMQLQ